MMAESKLVNRTRFISSLKNELVPQLAKLSEEAIEDLLKKYEKRRALY